MSGFLPARRWARTYVARARTSAPAALLARQGTIIEARHIGLLAGNGHASIQVRRRPRIAVLSTGDELVDAGRCSASIHDANRPMLLALCEGLGAEVRDLGICADDLGAMTRLLPRERDAIRHDPYLGRGFGRRSGLRSTGLQSAGGFGGGLPGGLKPGKPVFFGRLGDALLTGLPGNPLSAYTGFQLFTAPADCRDAGLFGSGDVSREGGGRLRLEAEAGRAEYLPVRIVAHDASGRPIVEHLGHGGSASLMPLSQADGVVVLDASSTEGACGTPVSWFPFCRHEIRMEEYMTDFAIPLQAAIRVEKNRPVDDIFKAVAELLRAKGLVVAASFSGNARTTARAAAGSSWRIWPAVSDT